MKLPKSFNPTSFEGRIYDRWCEQGYFTPVVDKSKKPYCIVMPPPNITGQLHMGHACNNTLQDIFIRYKRMQGYATLWLPGTDHASIATEVKIVEELKKEGIDKQQLGREAFLQRAFEWKEKYGGKIVEQLKKLGSSCDWSREAFTMDERCSKAVLYVFVNLYKKGLIYRGNRIINWCPDCKTALSDAEVEHTSQQGHLWYIRYPLVDNSGYITISTTRPETMLGDTAVAVNPNDKRYSHFIGKSLRLPLVDRVIPIVADDYVEKEFGTGAVKITPAHDANDFEVGARHNLDTIRVMNDDGSMNELAGAYQGMDRYVARKKIVADLKEQGLLEKIEGHIHNVGECYRCASPVGPIVSLQWFVKMQPLAEPAIEVVKNNIVKFLPKRFEKTYFNWMENIKDWCISRQLWWGHRIPAWYCADCGEIIVQETTPTICPKCKSDSLTQDEGILDTWFSSALWPFSTLGYPDKTEDLAYFYPTNVLITAYDIIFFWVARMIFSGIEHMNDIPFSTVLIHGIVRDALGRKMSKSLGNGIDPLEIIDKYGADTLRFCLTNGVAPGGDLRFSEERAESARNFMNKIWNAARFILMNIESETIPKFGSFSLTSADKWLFAKLNDLIIEVNRNLKNYEAGLACQKIYDFVWSEFCDWYIELAKPALNSGDQTLKENTLSVLLYAFRAILKVMHPFIPFITEEIWQALPNASHSIMVEKYPEKNAKFKHTAEMQSFEEIKEIIRAIRNKRAEMNVPSSRLFNIYIKSAESKYLASNLIYIQKLAGVQQVIFVDNPPQDKCAKIVLASGEIYIALGDLIDIEKEIQRLDKEKQNVLLEIARSEKMLGNAGFLAKAPSHLIQLEKDKLEKNKQLLIKITKSIQDYSV